MSHFGFVQLEFPGLIGLPEGRHLLRAGPTGEPDAVVVVGKLGAPRKPLVERRRARPAEPEPEPTPVPVTRVTVIDPAALVGEDAGDAWLKRMGGDDAEQIFAWALEALNRLVHAHRLAVADPLVIEITGEQALVVRIGHGSGDQVADGRWKAAVELPPARRRRERRTAALRPQERLAGLMSGRITPLACETLALRARHDLDHGRPREAALQLRVALEAALAELPGQTTGVASLDQRLAELAGGRETVAAAANAALQGELPDDLADAAFALLDRLEAALRARAAAGA